MNRRWIVRACAVAFCASVLLSLASYRHAYRMTHFLEHGQATASPGDLGALEKAATLVSGVVLPRPRNTRTPGELDLAFETVHFPSADGLLLEGWWIARPGALPDGELARTALLFHGYGASRQSLLEEARELWQLGFGVLLVDLRGAGGSEGTTTTLGWDEARDVSGALRFAREHLGSQRVLLYGASMGAVAVLRALAQEDLGDLQIHALILEAPFNSLLDTTSNRFHQMGLPAFPCAHLLVFWGGRQHGFDAFEHNPEQYIASVTQPALLLFGSADPDVTAADARALAARAPAIVTSVTFAGAGHPRLLPQQPQRWRREVRAFVARAFAR